MSQDRAINGNQTSTRAIKNISYDLLCGIITMSVTLFPITIDHRENEYIAKTRDT